MSGVATLSNEKNYTVFQFENHVIRFIAPYSLERYIAVKEWDNGYLVVMAKYKHNDKLEEEYIDLVPILQNLYLDVDKFLNPIKAVEVANGGCEASCGCSGHDCKWLCISPLRRGIPCFKSESS